MSSSAADDAATVPPDGGDTAVEDLLAECIELGASKGDTAVEELLERHPDAAARVRRVMASLQQLGIVDGSPASQPFTETLGEYELIERLGSGGMGVVFLARQRSVDRLVAVKVVHPALAANPRAAERFRREAQAVAKLQHPNIVTVYGTGEDRDVLYTAMEYVPGRGLDQLLAAEDGAPRPELRTVLQWVRDIARALECSHSHGIIHRDVKPSNIRIAEDGRAMLLDFGLARELGTAGLTRSGAFQGSPHYASPEQVEGRSDVGPATDIYSLGITLYQATCGELPFDGATTERVFHGILAGALRRPRQVVPSLPRDVETVILTAVEREPARRYGTAAELADDIEAVLDLRPIRAKPPTGVDRVLKFVRRNRALTAAIVVAFVALVAGAIGTWSQYVHARSEAVKARAISDFQQWILQLADSSGDSSGGPNVTFRTALVEAERRIEERLGGQPEAEAEVRTAIGNAFRSWREFDLAIEQLQRALALRRELHDASHPEVAKTENALGRAYHEKGDGERAEVMFRRALESLRAAHGEHHIEVARALLNLGSQLMALGRRDEGLPLLERALAAFRRLDADGVRSETATTLGHLAAAAYGRGEYDRQRQYLREALRTYEQAGVPEHAYAGVTRLNLGSSLRRLASGARERAEFEAAMRQAEEHLRGALSIFTKLYDPDHPYRVATRRQLHGLYRMWKKPELAATFADAPASGK